MATVLGSEPDRMGSAFFSSAGRGVAIAVLAVAALLSPAPATAQRVQARLFAQQDGLGNPSVTALAQDGDGYLWVATQNGLYRYDGSYFREFGRADGFRSVTFSNLVVDSSGRLWAGSRNGLFYWDRRHFHEVRFHNQPLHVGMSSRLTAAANGELILMDEDAPLSIRQDSATQEWKVEPYAAVHPGFPHLKDPNGIALDARGNLWFGADKGIGEFGPGGRRMLGPDDGLPSDYYVSIFLARNGRMWARGRKHIVTWLPQDRKVRDLTASFAGDLNTVYRRFAEDSFGNILTPSALGYSTWDGSQWTETRTTSQGPIDGATSLLSDREGAIWIGTLSSGVLETLGYRQWQNFGVGDSLQLPSIFGIVRDTTGLLWFGDNLGVNSLEPGRAPQREATVDPGAGTIVSLAPDNNGGVWAVATLGEALHLNRRHQVDIKINSDAYFYQVRVDAQGTVWIGTSSGLMKVQCVPGRKCVPERLNAPGMAAWQIYDFLFDRSAPTASLWMVGDHGLDYLSNGAVRHIPVAGVANDFSLIAPAPDGSLWLAGQMPGVIRVRVSGDRATIVESHARPQLASDYVEAMDTDHLGRLWLGTDHGINVIADGHIGCINDEDGLIWNDTDGKSFFEDRDGSIWIGTGKGISHLLHPAALVTRPPFETRIEPLRYDGSTVGDSASTPWTGGAAVLRFSALTFRGNRSIVYHFSLEGFDSKPVTTGVSFVRFQKLPPGTYTLHVVAEDRARHTFSAPASYRFTLTAPWWRTPFFYALLGLAGLALVALIWRSSHSVLLAQRRKLQRLVDERTRELQILATRDGLTGLMNRNAILSVLETECEAARRHKSTVCIALVDLDHFKQVNDTFGHLAGDDVLRQAAARLQGAVRTTDAVGRYGGEEFLVIFRHAQQDFGLARCEAIRKSLEEELVLPGLRNIVTTCSIGLACRAAESDMVSELLAQADRALYQAKANGRNRVEPSPVRPPSSEWIGSFS